MSDETQELYSLLVPLADDRLIVPRACVVEVVRFTQPDTEAGAHNRNRATGRRWIPRRDLVGGRR